MSAAGNAVLTLVHGASKLAHFIPTKAPGSVAHVLEVLEEPLAPCHGLPTILAFGRNVFFVSGL